MVYLQEISRALISATRPLLLENLEETSEAGQLNPVVDRLMFDELIEMAEEYLQIDQEIKKAKERKLRIWGQDKYLSKPLGCNIVERERQSKEVLKSIDTLQSRKDYIEYLLYLNRDNILSGVSPEILRNKINKPNDQEFRTKLRPYNPTLSDQSYSNAIYDDTVALPEFVIRKFQAITRRVTNQISNILDSKEAIIGEFKRLFIRGDIPKESRLLVEILVEHKRSNSNIFNPAA